MSQHAAVVSQHAAVMSQHAAVVSQHAAVVSQHAAAVSQPVSLPLLRHKGRPKPRYKPLYRDLPQARPPGAPRPCLSRYNTVDRDSTTKWAVAHSSFCFFFFCHIIFFLIPATGKPTQKYILYFFFIFQYNQINFLRFILFIFLPVLHSVNLRKISSHHFFSSPVASLLLYKCSSLDHCTSYNSKFFMS